MQQQGQHLTVQEQHLANTTMLYGFDVVLNVFTHE